MGSERMSDLPAPREKDLRVQHRDVKSSENERVTRMKKEEDADAAALADRERRRVKNENDRKHGHGSIGNVGAQTRAFHKGDGLRNEIDDELYSYREKEALNDGNYIGENGRDTVAQTSQLSDDNKDDGIAPSDDWKY